MGLGCPDLSLWPGLSAILGVDMKQMMEGEITVNQPDSGNIDKVRFYVCPSCGNILISTGSASIFCCGRKLEYLLPGDSSAETEITVEEMDTDWQTVRLLHQTWIIGLYRYWSSKTVNRQLSSLFLTLLLFGIG